MCGGEAALRRGLELWCLVCICIYNYTSSQDKIYILHSVSPTAHSPYLVSKCHLQDMMYMHVAVQMEVLYLAYTMYIMYMYCYLHVATTVHVGGFTST